MKKKNLEGKKLSLNKATVATLNGAQMNSVFGGLDDSKPRSSKGRTCGATMCDCPSTVASDKRVC